MSVKNINFYAYIHSHSTVPGLITPMVHVDSVSEITIDWSSSDSADIVRYIVNVREYSSAGPGKVQISSITGYPQQIPGTSLEHTVGSLGMHSLSYTIVYTLSVDAYNICIYSSVFLTPL